MTDQITHKINSKSKSSKPVQVVDGLPKHWEVKKLGDVCEIAYGKGLPVKELKSFGFPVFGANGIIGFYDKYLFEEPQVLISCRGAASGKINLSPSKCYVTNNSLVLDIKDKNKLDKTYLFYALIIAKKTKLVTGTAQPQVTINNAIELDISFPPLPEQQAIVAKIEELLSELDNGKQQLLTAQQQLKVYRQSLLKWAFEGKLCLNYDTPDLYDDHDKINHQENQGNQKNQSSDNGEIPKGWKLSSIGEIFEVFIGSTPKRNIPEYWGGNINWLSSGEIAFCNITKTRENITEEGLKNSACKVHPIGTVIIAMIGEGKTRGQAAILKIPSAHNQNTAAIRVEENIYSSKLLYYYLVLKYEENRRVGSGNNQKALNKERVKSIQIPLPPLSEQQLIVSELEIKLTICDKIEETISQSLLQAETLKQSILKQAFEGKLLTRENRNVTNEFF